MKTVVLDTNFLLVPFQFKIDIKKQIEELLEEPHELVVPSGVLSELKKLGKGKGKEGSAARFALKLVGILGMRKVRSSGNVDAWIMRYARKEGAIVCTNDVELRHKLKNGGVKIIVLRSRARLGVA